MDLPQRRLHAAAIGFPRTRGDGPQVLVVQNAMRAFPPHTRGWTQGAGTDAHRQRVSPAHAGMDPLHSVRLRPRKCFPRTRGDGPVSSSVMATGSRFPPHTRGWTGVRFARVRPGRVSPAHAGMDLLRSGARALNNCFPRTRGDGPNSRFRATATSSFPPHTRGWTVRRSQLRP